MSFTKPLVRPFTGPLLASALLALGAFASLNTGGQAEPPARTGVSQVRVKGPAEARALAYPALGRLPYEAARAYFVAADGTVLKTAVATQRLRHGVYYVPWEIVFADLTPWGTHRIYLVHNHPGGNPALSAYDVRLGSFWATRAAREGIAFDLLAVTPAGEYTSLRESGQLQPVRRGWALVRDYAGYVGGPLVWMAEAGLRERLAPLDLAGDRCYNNVTETPKWWNWQTR